MMSITLSRTTSATARIAIIGGGAISTAHIAGCGECPDELQVAAICDPRPAAREGLPNARGYASVDDLLVDAADYDLAVLCLPHHLHYPIAAQCMRAGLAVLIEKPITTSCTDLGRLIELERETGTRCFAGQNRRYDPEVEYLQRWIAEDQQHFGDLRSFVINANQNVWAYANSGAGADHWIFDKNTAGGGVVVSLAIHSIDLLRFLGGEDIQTVHASGRFAPPFINGAEIMCCGVLTTTSGAPGALHATFGAALVENSETLTMFGSNGTITNAVQQTGTDSAPWRSASTGGIEPQTFGEQFTGFAPIPVTDRTSSFGRQLQHVCRALRDGSPTRTDPIVNFNTLATVEALMRSIESGRVETVEPTPQGALP